MKGKEVIIMRMKGYTTYFIVINVIFHSNPCVYLLGGFVFLIMHLKDKNVICCFIAIVADVMETLLFDVLVVAEINLSFIPLILHL